jgi:hypothetical protein
MSIIFSYAGTTPATVVTLQTGPDMGDFAIKKVWMSPEVKAAGGEDSFVYNKGIVKLFHTLNVRQMKEADYLSLIDFLDIVDGISNTWDYTDPAAVVWLARFWNAEEIRASLVRHGREAIDIILLVTAPP